MSEPAKMVSEVEAVRRERKAYEDGAVCWAGEARARSEFRCGTVTLAGIQQDAACKYPLPLVTRPRVVRDTVTYPDGSTSEYEWCVLSDGQLVRRLVHRGGGPPLAWAPAAEWRNLSDLHAFAPTPKRIAMWADLLAHPTETVEDDSR